MTTDGGLRSLFRKHLPQVDWQAIETWGTGQGVPDLNGCAESHEFWIELKATSAWSVAISPEQVAWAERRLRHGGLVWLAVRRKHNGGPRLGLPVDELWLFNGADTRSVMLAGLDTASPVLKSVGGPSAWDWKGVFSFLCG